MRITNTNVQLTTNFKMDEFWHAANPSQDFVIPDSLIKAAQIIRDWWDKPITITSTYRPHDTFGYHLQGKAIDFVASDPNERQQMIDAYNTELKNYHSGKGSNLISAFRQVGVTGMGIESACVHFDCRGDNVNLKDQYGMYCIFVFRCHYENGLMVIDENYALT